MLPYGGLPSRAEPRRRETKLPVVSLLPCLQARSVICPFPLLFWPDTVRQSSGRRIWKQFYTSRLGLCCSPVCLRDDFRIYSRYYDKLF